VVGTPLKSLFTGFDLDTATGRVVPAGILYGDLCGGVLRGGSHMTAVDLDAGTAALVAQVASCTTGVAADPLGRAVHATIGPYIPSRCSRPGRGALYPGMDPVKVSRLLLAGFVAAEDYVFDNSATGAVGIFGRESDKRLALLRDFNTVAILGNDNYFKFATSGIQLDPRTRTGWTLRAARCAGTGVHLLRSF
jgi:hypothetical protein